MAQQDDGTTYTLAEMVERTGAERQWVQRWSEAGILLPAPGTLSAGRGAHRRYGNSELAVAAILTPIAAWGVTIGQLAKFASVIRASLLAPGGFEAESPYRGALARAASGFPVFVIVAQRTGSEDLALGVVDRRGSGWTDALVDGRPLSEYQTFVAVNLTIAAQRAFVLPDGADVPHSVPPESKRG